MLDFLSIFIIYMITTHKTSKVPFLNLKKVSLIHKGIHFKCSVLLFNISETICNRDQIQGNDQTLHHLFCLICAL